MDLTIQDKTRYFALKRKCKSAWIEFAAAVLEIRENKLYLTEYKTFEEFCGKELNITKQHAYRLLDAGQVVDNLKSNPGVTLPQYEKHVRPLTKLEPELQRETWTEVIEENEPEKITAKIVAAKVEEKRDLNEALKEVKRDNQPDTIFVQTPLSEAEIMEKAREIEKKKKVTHVSLNTGNNEWYTPEKYIESARLVMGSIDLDPASSEIANKTVKAKKYYSQQDNGLNKKWSGNVWLNPPYSKDLINDFILKASEENVQNICVLVNNATETAWGQALLNIADCVCFISKRIKFLDHTGTPAKSPLQGQMVIFKGENKKQFLKEFSKHGICVKR